MTLETQQDCHGYNTRNKNKLKLPKITRNWGRQRFRYQAADDYNSLSNDIKDSSNIQTFKQRLFYLNSLL